MHPLLVYPFQVSYRAELWYKYYLGGAQSIALGFVPLGPKFDSAPLCTPSGLPISSGPRELKLVFLYYLWGAQSNALEFLSVFEWFVLSVL